MIFPVDTRRYNSSLAWVNLGLIVINVAIFFAMLLDLPHYKQVIQTHGLRPAHATAWTLFSCMFVHAGTGHIAANMYFLWVFGANVERRMGSFWYLLGYLACGALANICYVLLNRSSEMSEMPLVGASGAIAAVMGFYMALFPGRRLELIIIPVITVFSFYLSAKWLVGSYLILQLVEMITEQSEMGGVAYSVHILGILFGAAVGWIFSQLKPGTPAPGFFDEPRQATAPGRAQEVHTRSFPSARATSSSSRRFFAGRETTLLFPREFRPLPVEAVQAAITLLSPPVRNRILEAHRNYGGYLLKSVPTPCAEAVSSILQEHGHPCVSLPMQLSVDLPATLDLDDAALLRDGAVLQTFDGSIQRIRYPSLHLVSAGWVETPPASPEAALDPHAPVVIDFFAIDPWRCYRLNGRFRKTTLWEELLPGLEDRSLAALAAEFMAKAKGVRRNPGMRILAESGSWDELRFSSLQQYDFYNLYILLLVQLQKMGRRSCD